MEEVSSRSEGKVSKPRPLTHPSAAQGQGTHFGAVGRGNTGCGGPGEACPVKGKAAKSLHGENANRPESLRVDEARRGMCQKSGQTHFRLRAILFIIFAALGLFTLGEIRAETFSLRVKQEGVWTAPDGGTIYSTNTYLVNVDGSRALIELVKTEFDKDKSRPEIRFYTDGTDGFQLDSYGSSVPGDVINDGSLEVFPSPVPKAPKALISFVWQAYCSASYYNGLTNNSGAPAFYVAAGFREKGKEVSIAKNCLTLPPRLPEYVCEYFDSSIYLRSELDGQLAHMQIPNKTVTNGIYAVAAWTNIAGLSLPSAYTARHFRFDMGRNEQVCDLLVKGELETARLGNLVRLDEIPLPITKATRVLDFRFKFGGEQMQPIIYLSTEGKIKTRQEVAELDDYKRKAHFFAIPEVVGNENARLLRRRLTVITLCILTLVFMMTLLRWNSHKQKNHKQ
jgi:hypothetical protein